MDGERNPAEMPGEPKAITDHEPAKGWQVDDITRELIDEAARYLCRDIMFFFIRIIDTFGLHLQSVFWQEHMNPCAISLVDGKVRKKFVECGVRNFEDTILKYLLGRSGSRQWNR